MAVKIKAPEKTIQMNVALALREDVATGDVSAALLPADAQIKATLIARESAVICGQAWFNESFRQLDDSIQVNWLTEEASYVAPNKPLCEITGSARNILTGERTALNFLQLFSGVATQTRRYVERVKGTKARILDTRKTVPGLRAGQKYAVACGGGQPHRMGLYDAFMIKENHITVAGSISAAVDIARQNNPKNLPIIVEAEDLTQAEEALERSVDVLLLDNFATHLLARAANMGRTQRRYNRGQTLLEASGGITLQNVREIADTGVDRISIGGLTKNVTAVDLSLRVD
ncbi:MAG: carboxylating nicotinate-nucleotide diphosphorylase [Oceanococcus sp.]